MLVLQRRVGESIVLQHPKVGDVTIRLVGILGTQRAKIGVIAPRSVNIKREELPERSQQGEEAPETFYKADRERAKIGLSDYQIAYVERLERIVKASDDFWTAMQVDPMSPRQYRLSEALLEANASVNFCSERDSVELPECVGNEEENELPRDVIFK